MAINSSIQTLKTYVEMMVRYRIWSVCVAVILCAVIWFASPEAGSRQKTVSIIGVLFLIGWACTFFIVPMLQKQIDELENDEKKKAEKQRFK